MILKLTTRVLEDAEQPHFIITPRHKLLSFAWKIFIVWTVLLTATYAITAYVTIPLLVYSGYIYFLFSRIWCSCKFSKFYVIVFPVLSLFLSFIFKFIIYKIV